MTLTQWSELSTSSPLRSGLFGVSVDCLTMEETVARCIALIRSRSAAHHVVLNAGKVVLMTDHPRLREAIRRSDLVSADGQAIVWASRWLGTRLPERVTGIDLMERLLVEAERNQWAVYLLGATPQILAKFGEVVRRRLPGLAIAGAHHGYFEDDARMASEVRDSGARLLFVAMPSPRKEYFIADQADRLGPIFTMGVGGSFDVWAGLTRRAPLWMQRAGLEWFYRLLQEPRRMWRRYLVGNFRFVVLVLREIVTGRRE